MDDFIVPDDSDEEAKRSKKRKRPPKAQSRDNKSPLSISPLNDDNLEIATVSTAEQWTYDPKNTQPLRPRSDAATNALTKKSGIDSQKRKEKAHQSEPDQRYPWL